MPKIPDDQYDEPYPLISAKHPASKKKQKNDKDSNTNNKNKYQKFDVKLTSFFTKLFAKGANTFLMDDEFLTCLTEYLAVFSQSSFRGLRHTGTFLGLKLITFLIKVYIHLYLCVYVYTHNYT